MSTLVARLRTSTARSSPSTRSSRGRRWSSPARGVRRARGDPLPVVREPGAGPFRAGLPDAGPRPHPARDRLDDRAGRHPADHRHPHHPGDLPDPGAPRAPRRARVTVRGWQWWWEFRYPDSTSSPPTSCTCPRAAGRASPAGPGRDPQLLGAPARRQARRDPGRAQPDLASPPTRPASTGASAPSSAASPTPTCASRVIVEAPEASSAGSRPEGAAGRSRPGRRRGQGDLRAQRVRGLPHHRGVSAGALGPDLTHFGSRDARRRHAAQHPREPRRLAEEPAALKPGAKMPNLGLTDAEARRWPPTS